MTFSYVSVDYVEEHNISKEQFGYLFKPNKEKHTRPIFLS